MSEPDPRLTAPRRVLTVSADMGGGHNATAAALEETAMRLWPGSDLRRLDTLNVMGPGVGRLFRKIYVSNVESTPWLYEFFYSSLWRHRWFAESCKRLTGSWCGRRLIGEIDRFDPDLILSTYPLGSSGLDWLKQHRGLRVPVAGYISDFAPHPFWVYPAIDCNLVVHEAAAPVARAADARSSIEVCAPPVTGGFQRGDRSVARRELGLPERAFVVLISCGAYSYGDVKSAAEAVLEAAPEVQVVVACGRSESTRAAFERLALPPERLVALGWTDQMESYIRASDVVLSNAGGATALETLASGRPVLLSDPIAAHGVANAELMVVSGLAELCRGQAELVSWVSATVRERQVLRQLGQRADEHLATHDLDRALTRLAGVNGRDGDRPVHPAWSRGGVERWRMRAQDAFFCHVEKPSVAQELGTVLDLGEIEPGRPLGLEELTRAVEVGVQGLPPLRRRMVLGTRPCWDTVPVRVADHLGERRVEGGDEQVWAAVDDFWSRPMRRDRPAWELLLIHAPQVPRTVLAVKLHHAYGDGISALGLFDRILRAAPDDPLRERTPIAERGPSGPGPARHPLAVLGQGRSVIRGLVSLATRGRPPAHPLNRPISGPDRQVVFLSAPRDVVHRLSASHRAKGHEVALALVADALRRVLGPPGLLTPGRAQRVMVPVAMRLPRLDRVFGNWAGTVTLDLPLEPMPLGERIARIREETERRLRRGEPQAAVLVLRLAGRLPEPWQGPFARLVYTRRFFSSIVSYMPAARGPRWCAGAPVRALYPVMPLADGVPLTVGVVVSGDTMAIGVTCDPALGLSKTAVADAFGDALRAAEHTAPDWEHR